MSETARLNEAVTPWLEGARAGNREAYEGLVRACYGRVYRWALVTTGDPDDAQDVTQEVVVRLERGIRRWEERSSFTTWLYRVTRNAAADFHRREGRRAAVAGTTGEDGVEPATPGPDPEERLQTGRLAAMVRHLLHALPKKQRVVFDLVDLQDHTPAEVSAMLDMKQPTVRAHLFKARRAIRTRLSQLHPALIEDYRR